MVELVRFDCENSYIERCDLLDLLHGREYE